MGGPEEAAIWLKASAVFGVGIASPDSTALPARLGNNLLVKANHYPERGRCDGAARACWRRGSVFFSLSGCRFGPQCLGDGAEAHLAQPAFVTGRGCQE